MFLALALAAQASLSLDLHARPLSGVLRVLSKSTGTALECQPGFENEIILLKASKRSASEIREKLAIAMDAEWRRSGDTLILVRSEERRKQLETEAATRRRAEAQQLLDQIAKHLARTPTKISRMEAFRTAVKKQSGNLDLPFLESVPGYWVAKMTLDLGLQPILDIPQEGELVFSNQPNRLQRAFPAATMVDYAKLLEEMSELRLRSEGDANEAQYFRDRVGANARPGKALLTLRRTGSYAQFWLTVYDEREKSIFSAFQSSYNTGSDPYGEADKLAKGAQERWVPLRGLSAEFAKVRDPHPEYSNPTESPVEVKPSRALREALLNPELTDPLSFWDADAVIALAGDDDICARLPDRLDFAMRTCLAEGKINVGKFKLVAEKVGTLKLDRRAGWLVGTATNPLTCEQTRFNRAALGRFLRSNDKAGKVSLDSLSRYYFEAGRSATRFGFWIQYLATFTRFGIKDLPSWEGFPYEVYAMIGSLSESQKIGLRKGEFLRLAGTSGKQRQAFFELLSHAYVSGEKGVEITDLFRVRSEWMARVPLEESRFFLFDGEELVVTYPVLPGQPDYLGNRAVTAFEYGNSRGSWPEFSSARLPKVFSGKRQLVQVRLKPHPSLVYEAKFEISKTMGKEKTPFDQLPEVFQREAQEAYEKARKEYMARNGG